MDEMTITQFVEWLQTVLAEHGDLPVYITGEWYEPLCESDLEITERDDNRKRVGINIG